MASSVFNIAKGRVAEMYNRVDSNDPANSALIMLVLATSGLEADATLLDCDTVSALLSGTTNEVTNTNYGRKTITDGDLSAMTPDDTNDRMEVTISTQTFSSIAAGDGWSKVVIAYDPDTTGGTDTTLVPLTLHDFVATPSGENIAVSIPSTGFFRAA
jgi:hypothetical protein